MAQSSRDLERCAVLLQDHRISRDGSHFFDFDQTPSLGSYPFLPLTTPIASIIASMRGDSKEMGCQRQEVDITYQGRTLRGVFEDSITKSEHRLSFYVPHTRLRNVDVGGILAINFFIKIESSQLLVNHTYLDGLYVKSIGCLDEYKNEGWADLPHSGTYIMKMCDKLFRHLRITSVYLLDKSHTGKDSEISYTALRFFQGKGSWYENFGYKNYPYSKRDNARKLLKTTPILTLSKDSVLPEPPNHPDETIFDYLARFALSDIEKYGKIFRYLNNIDETDILERSFNTENGMIIHYKYRKLSRRKRARNSVLIS